MIVRWEQYKNIEELGLLSDKSYECFFPKNRNQNSAKCFGIYPKGEKKHLIELSYFVGVDWIEVNKTPLYIEPKLNGSEKQTNYLEMLFSALKHPEICEYIDDLFEIKFDSPHIEIAQKQDLLTPLLIVQFLSIMREIVRKGLKKSYYKIEKNLHCRIKGKVLIGNTIKQNHLKNKPLQTYCSYEEFGYNNLENRLLKKTMIFIQNYMPNLKIDNSEEYTTKLFNYIMPVFSNVSEEIEINEIKHQKFNAFYKEYSMAIKFAKLILKRFGYNIVNSQKQEKIKTPPFWIDMSKLFEMYVLSMLKDRFTGKNEVLYHFTVKGNELDYLLNTKEYKMVIDAKYKPVYKSTQVKNDMRQISGYARLNAVYRALSKKDNELIDCLIIYPDQTSNHKNLLGAILNEEKFAIKTYKRIFKIGVELPLIDKDK